MSDTGEAGAASGSADEERQLVRRLRPVVAVWAVLALVVVAAIVVATPAPEVNGALFGWVALLVGLVIAAGLIDFPIYVGRVKESVGLGELGLLPVMLLLPPTVAVAVAFVGVLVVEIVLTRGYRGRAAKLTFNVAFQVVSVGLGSWLHLALVGPGLPLTAWSLAIAMLVAFLDLVVNALAMGSIRSLAFGDPLGVAARNVFDRHLVASLAASFTGILLAVVLVAAPVALPLVLVPILVYRRSARDRAAHEREVRLERDRFERTVAGATDGVVLLDAAGLVEVWNPAMVALSNVAAEEAVGQPLDELGWQALLSAGTGPTARRVPVEDRVVEVRRSDLPHDAGSVLLVQDVSREVELARIREDLVSRISHELRTPLTTVEGFVETLDERWGALSDEERRRLVAVARQGAHRLSHLVDKLLVWSGIEARDPRAHLGERGPPVGDPAAVVERFVAEGSEDLRLDLPAPGTANLVVAMTEGDLDLIVQQLVANARSYGRPPIVLGVVEEGDHVRLEVTDHGDGVPEAFVPDAFQPFRQGVEGLQRTARGLGLGLAIVHSLAVGAAGTVVVERASEAGARFVVRLPRAGR